MSSWRPPLALVERLHRKAQADRWDLSRERLSDALERSARKAFASEPDASELAAYCDGLHLTDLALACACAAGVESAWDHFVREFRPILYRSAEAIDHSGGARELADSLYAELFGLTERDGRRWSHFDYFHGRSSLATWLRAVLSQRHVDRVRRGQRLTSLDEDDPAGRLVQPVAASRDDAERYLNLMRGVLVAVVAQLAPKDRLRLMWYYAHNLTLAQIGRAFGEHEATVSRHLTRTRKEIRTAVEQRLRDDERMSEVEMAECFQSVLEDVQNLDVTELLGRSESPPPLERKSASRPRSKERSERARV